MKDLIPKEIVDTFKLLYADVNDIDLFIAGISERPAHGAILGPTFQVMCFSCKESKKQAAVKNKAVIRCRAQNNLLKAEMTETTEYVIYWNIFFSVWLETSSSV